MMAPTNVSIFLKRIQIKKPSFFFNLGGGVGGSGGGGGVDGRTEE